MGEPIQNPGFFDAHCDTVMKLLDAGEDFLQPGGSKHLSWPEMQDADVRYQVFACFVLSARYPGIEYARACEMIDAVEGMAHATGGGLQIVRTSGDLARAATGEIRAAILSLEGADPLGDDPERLRDFFDRGVRSLIFAWQDNAFSGTAFGTNTPLSAQGRALLALCEDLGVVVDVSHLSDRGFDDVASLSTRPFVATHSNCRSLCPSPRNLTDAMIRTWADRGGVRGLNLSPAFLDPAFLAAVNPLREESLRPGISEDEKRSLWNRMMGIPSPPLDWAVRHIQHAMAVGGEDCIGMGGDLDGISRPPEGIDSVADYIRFLPLLEAAGLSERQIEKVCYRNFLRAFSELLPA